ncbi:MAG: hypothetical protein FJZ58_02775 [Chlamydiae bacterium]|nr:hypothetical protein [Chlamydiota bacterium]
MKKYVFASLLALSSGLFAEQSDTQTEGSVLPPRVNNAFMHVDLGLGPCPVPLPSFALGHRNQWNHHGLDVSLSVTTVVAATQLKFTPMYLYYFTPNLQSEFYMGFGLGTSVAMAGQTFLALSPEFVMGKEYRTEAGSRRFFQTSISFPTFAFGGGNDEGVLYFPLVVFSYGICF